MSTVAAGALKVHVADVSLDPFPVPAEWVIEGDPQGSAAILWKSAEQPAGRDNARGMPAPESSVIARSTRRWPHILVAEPPGLAGAANSGGMAAGLGSAHRRRDQACAPGRVMPSLRMR